MKKVQTHYCVNVGERESWDSVDIIVSEETPDHMKVQFFQERRRSKAEHIKLLKSIISELESF